MTWRNISAGQGRGKENGRHYKERENPATSGGAQN
jgi:hypothetical protein